MSTNADNAGRVAAFYGPILLAGDLGPGDFAPETPVVVADKQAVSNRVVVDEQAPLPLKPFHQAYDHRHQVYWKVLSADQCRQREVEIAAERRHEQELVAACWGSETGPREFDVLINGERIATQLLHRDRPDQFWARSTFVSPPGPATTPAACLGFAPYAGSREGSIATGRRLFIRLRAFHSYENLP